MKAWQRDRMELLFIALDGLTVAQEEEIARICEEEKTYLRERFADGAGSSLKKPMTDARNAIRQQFQVLNDSNSWLNPREGEREHISLKYLNWSQEEWRMMNEPTEKKKEERQDNQQVLEDPDAIVAKSAELLLSDHWEDIACGLAVVTGCRVTEVLKTGQASPCTLYTIIFAGQLKQADATLEPYEKPTLVPATQVLTAWTRLREKLDCSSVDKDQISSRYGPAVVATANHHFADLVPVRPNSTRDLYTHLFRSVYPCIAFYYFAPTGISLLSYYPTILGHYWLDENEEKRRNVAASYGYMEYTLSDAVILKSAGKRQGVMLDLPGVEVLKVYQKPTIADDQHVRKGKTRDMDTPSETLQLKKKSQTGYSSARPKENTRARFDKFLEEEGLTRLSSKDDAGMIKLLDEHYQFKQVAQFGDIEALALVLADAAQDNESNPVGYLAGLVLAMRRLLQVTQWEDIEALALLLADAATDSDDPVKYLADLLAAKRKLKATYEGGRKKKEKDFEGMSIQQLKDERSTGASMERWRRGVNAIMQYNVAVEVPELRWYINPTIMNVLVGGKPPQIAKYLATRQAEIDAHHKEYGVTSSANKKGGVKITDRIHLGLESAAEETDEPEEEQTVVEQHE